MDADKPKHSYEQIRQIINERISLMDEKMGSAGEPFSGGQRQMQQCKPKARNNNGLWQALTSFIKGSKGGKL